VCTCRHAVALPRPPLKAGLPRVASDVACRRDDSVACSDRRSDERSADEGGREEDPCENTPHAHSHPASVVRETGRRR
jgi:hypothetical protein